MGTKELHMLKQEVHKAYMLLLQAAHAPATSNPGSSRGGAAAAWSMHFFGCSQVTGNTVYIMLLLSNPYRTSQTAQLRHILGMRGTKM